MSNNQDLSQFNWEQNPEELDFFGIKDNKYQEQVDTDKPFKAPKSEEEPDKDKETVEEVTPTFDFGEETTEEVQDTTNPDKKKPGRPAKETQQPSNFVDHYNEYKTLGFFNNIELEEDVESLDEEEFKDLLSQDYEAEVETRISQWAQDLDAEAQAFIKFKRNGGSTKDFLKTVGEFSNDLKGNIQDESFQNKVIRKQLESEGWDNEEIEDRIEHLTKIDKKESTAQKYYDKIQEKSNKEAEKLLKSQENYKRQQEESKRSFRENVKQSLTETTEVKGFRITPKDKNNLFNFITKEDQTVGNRNVTGFQRAITEAVQDPDKLILLAKILESDFDFSDLEKKVKTKQTQQIKENLESRKGLRPGTSGGSQLGGGKSLADLFS